ncbi:MAG: 50S ribosomal protein L25 [Candidatus Omnitrophota bacterium]|nr:50S ribosomal protein L25 [Candidatus Omnitrophota bacterium]
MEEISLSAALREDLGRGKVKDLREKGFIPAVVYAQGRQTLVLQVSRSELLRLVHQHHNIESVVINLKVKDSKKEKARPCLIKEIQYEPVHGGILHVDFNEISLTKAIKINLQVVAKGESIGVKQEGGSLEHHLWEVEVECLPTNIPQNIEVDVSNMKMGDAIHVRDLKVPVGVKILNDPEAAVLSIAEPMKEEVPAEAVEGEIPLEPEVIKEKKEVPAEEGQEQEVKEKEAKEKKEEK